MKIQQYDIYEKCSPDVGENDGRTFRIIGTHPEELLPHIHHSMIFGVLTIFTDFRLQTKISRDNAPPRELRSYDHVLSKKSTRTHPEELLVEISIIKLTKSRGKKVENDENWNVDKFGCRGRSAFGIGAKHI